MHKSKSQSPLIQSMMAFTNILTGLEINPDGFKKCENCQNIFYACSFGSQKVKSTVYCCKSCGDKYRYQQSIK